MRTEVPAMHMNACTKPTSMPIKKESRALMAKIIFESAKFNKASNAKTIRAKSRRLLYNTSDRKKLIARLPATITARYTITFQGTNRFSFRNIL
jgi:hypothetical protein